MKVLSLFSGIGAFEKTLKNINIEFEIVNYCEIDKYASKSYSLIHNVLEEKNLWDVKKVNTSKLPKDIDLITYGFPCQDISLAGKQKGLFNEDGSQTRSGLFFEALRIIEDTKPKYAVAENVKNLTSKKFNAQFQIVLSSLEAAGYNNYWQVLNAKDYGIPQNRERVFIVSIRKDIDPGSFQFPKPFELKLRLKDMLEAEVDEKYYLSESAINYILGNAVNKELKDVIKRENMVFNKDIAYCLNTKPDRRIGDSNYIIPEIEEEINVKDYLAIKEATKQGYAEAYEGDSVNLEFPGSETRRGRVGKQIAQTLTTGCQQGVVVKDKIKLRIRKLTPKECWRLMGFEDSDFEKSNGIVSNTQLYKQAGNSIVVDVLEHILKNLLVNKTSIKEEKQTERVQEYTIFDFIEDAI